MFEPFLKNGLRYLDIQVNLVLILYLRYTKHIDTDIITSLLQQDIDIN